MLDQGFATRPRKLLLTTDLDDGGTTALRLGSRWASRFGADVAACHVVPGPAGDRADVAQVLARTVYQLRSTFDVAERKAEDLDVIVNCGDPRRKLVEAANACSADLVVVGAAPRRLGAVAEAVLECAHCSVLVARPWFRRGAVIAACDLSDSSLTAVATANAAAERFDLPLVVVHAATRSGGDESIGLELENREATLDALAAPLAGIGVSAELRVCDAPPSSAILGAERIHGATLVVLGAQGVSRRTHSSLGSVAREVVRAAGCSVLIVR
jgi:nucleotide-binding universal stress UspA family protein